ncbi:MAG: sensor histidine kinase [Gemmatimonadales bacterium]
MAPVTSSWRRRVALSFAVAPAVFGALMFWHRYGDLLARGNPGSVAGVLLEEMTGAYAGVPGLAALLALVLRWPMERRNWLRRLPGYLGATVVAGVTTTLLIWGIRSALFPLFGLGRYDYGVLWWRIPMELGLQVIMFSMAIGLFHFGRYYRETRTAEVRAAALEAALVRARLDAIEARLEPHFLFNSLNTISAVMYEDLATADRLLGQLGDLLRRAMTRDAPATVPLRDELAWLEAYLGLMQQRFGARLQVDVAVAPELAEVPVPRFLLQPLVENAIRHGVASKSGPGHVAVAAARNGSRLELVVRDDGRGFGQSGEPGTGAGLSATTARLQLLYGADHAFEVTGHPDGGTVARVAVPLAGTA